MFRIFKKLEMCPTDTDAPPEKLKGKLLTPEKLNRKLLTPSRTRSETNGRTGVTLYVLSTIFKMAGA